MASTTIGAAEGSAGEYSRIHGKVTNQSKENSMVKAFKEIETMCQRIGLNRLASLEWGSHASRSKTVQSNCLKKWMMRNC